MNTLHTARHSTAQHNISKAPSSSPPPHLVLEVVQADSPVHGELPGALCELVHLVIQVLRLTLTLLQDGLNVGVWSGGGGAGKGWDGND
jgi:hypothetical protein